jgi:non-ribosomal peptide synthase protein (TIGR01720 family)
VDAVVEAGVFSVEVTYSPDVHAAETVAGLRDRFLAELRSLIAHCLSGASGATPSDFPLAGLDQAELDVVAGLLDDDEDEDT